MLDVFVSYKKEDYGIAERLVSKLKENKLSIWWDDGLTPKSAWDAEIEQRIAAASAVVVLWTPQSVSSEWVRAEAHYGQDRGKLIPLMAERCTIPIAFMLRQTIDLCDWRGEAEHRQWRKLLAWIADLAATKAGNANIPNALAATQPNAFRNVVGHLSSGEPIVDGELVNASTPAGTVFRDGDTMPVMRILPHGSFLLGSVTSEPGRSVAEGPQKRIEIPASFAMSIFPVLVSEFEAAGKPQTPAHPSPLMNPLQPVTNVSYEDVKTYVTLISSTAGENYRLPSEAEWEYACRSGSRGMYSFGDTIDATMASFNSSAGPVPPGSFPANAFGLYDMHGNVREWTEDLWHESYETTPLDGRPATDGHSSMRVVRGGGWNDGASMLRSAARMRATQSIRSNLIGFRVVRALR